MAIGDVMAVAIGEVVMERGGDSYELNRLDRRVAELAAIRFELGETAFVG